jgi:hypothetical protein
MEIFTIDGDGSPLGIASTATPRAAMSLMRQLCWAYEFAADEQSEFRQSPDSPHARLTASEEVMFQRAAVSGSVRLAGILIADNITFR